MKQLVLWYLLCLLVLGSCKKEEEDPPGTIYVNNSGTIKATPPPPGFTFPKNLKESGRTLEFKMWVKGTDVSNKANPEKIFDYNDWISPFPDIVLLNSQQFKIDGEPGTFGYFFYQNGMYVIDGDTFPFPIAMGTHARIELYDYRVKITSGGMSQSSSVFEKATRTSLEKQAAEWGITNIDTMAYLNRTLILK